jgi:uncharacterized protein YcgI (DUF1989 family)
VLQVIEHQRKKEAHKGEEQTPHQDMSGELQTIPARHGVATFVPRGRTIKIINTYGKQVVSTWAFSLGAPPEDGEGEEEIDEEEIEEKTEELKKEVLKDQENKKVETAEKPDESEASGKAGETDNKGEPEEDHGDPSEQAPETPENDKSTEDKKQPEKRTWASYLPSIPYRSRGTESKTEEKVDTQAEKAQNEAASRAWSSYLPTGKSFSSYVPNVQLPDSQTAVSAFKASHYRDPNKSYAEQLYDFSKTPVGAGGIAGKSFSFLLQGILKTDKLSTAATGSGTASSIYAAYNAYRTLNPSSSDQPPMEYLSLPHTRATTHRLVPEVDDTLLTNLRSPIMTLVEDTTPGAHDTLTAACDASQYMTLGVDKPEEHGSCAENLVLALKELNEKAGLKGTKAVGADITVNIAPTPLHLFMNAPIDVNSSAQSEGAGAKGASLKVEEPKGKKRSYVRFRADRDIVIVMSACPMEVGKQNGGKCMAANFMVEEASEEDLATSTGSVKKKTPKTANSPKQESPKKQEEVKEQPKAAPKAMPKPRGGPAKIEAVKKSAEAAEAGRRDSAIEPPKPEKKDVKKEQKTEDSKIEETKNEESPKPKKKPKKLEKRSVTPAKSDAS